MSFKWVINVAESYGKKEGCDNQENKGGHSNEQK